jgi:hypothetical protein
MRLTDEEVKEWAEPIEAALGKRFEGRRSFSRTEILNEIETPAEKRKNVAAVLEAFLYALEERGDIRFTPVSPPKLTSVQ